MSGTPPPRNDSRAFAREGVLLDIDLSLVLGLAVKKAPPQEGSVLIRTLQEEPQGGHHLKGCLIRRG